MNKETANRISTVFIVLSVLIIAGVAILGLPQLFKREGVTSIVDVKQNSAELPPTSSPPTSVPSETPFPTETPNRPAAYATERSMESTLEAVKIKRTVWLTAKQNITLFVNSDGSGGETDYFVVQGQQVEVIQTVPNRDWVLVRHPLGELGWAIATQFDLPTEYLELLPLFNQNSAESLEGSPESSESLEGSSESSESLEGSSESAEPSEIEIALNDQETVPNVTMTTTPAISLTQTATQSLSSPTPTPTFSPTLTPILKLAGTLLLSTDTPNKPSPSPTPKAPVIRALNDSAMFAGKNGGSGRIGYFIPEGKIAWALGKSEDGNWLHIVSDLNVEGWAARERFDLVSGSLDDLPLSEFVTQPRADVTPDFLLTVTPVPTQRPASTRIPQPTAVPLIQVPSTELPQSLPALPVPTPIPFVEEVAPVSSPIPATVRPTSQPIVRPTQIQPKSPTTPTHLPAAATPRPTAELAPNEAVSVAVAFWKIDSSATTSAGNGTWRTSLIVRVPTSFSYQFNIDYLIGSTLSSRNRDGDDIYLLTLAGIPCGQAIQTELVARQNGARMTSRNDATFADTPIFLSYNCQ